MIRLLFLLLTFCCTCSASLSTAIEDKNSSSKRQTLDVETLVGVWENFRGRYREIDTTDKRMIVKDLKGKFILHKDDGSFTGITTPFRMYAEFITFLCKNEPCDEDEKYDTAYEIPTRSLEVYENSVTLDNSYYYLGDSPSEYFEKMGGVNSCEKSIYCKKKCDEEVNSMTTEELVGSWVSQYTLNLEERETRDAYVVSSLSFTKDKDGKIKWHADLRQVSKVPGMENLHFLLDGTVTTVETHFKDGRLADRCFFLNDHTYIRFWGKHKLEVFSILGFNHKDLAMPGLALALLKCEYTKSKE